MTRIAPIIVLICVISGVIFGFAFFDHSHDKPTRPPESSTSKKDDEKQDRLKSAPDVDFGPYMSDLQRRIKKAWFPPKGNETKQIIVIFKIHADGTMSNLRVSKSSNNTLADQAAMKAVVNAAPFRKLPQGAPKDVDIQFTFDYNVFQNGKKQDLSQTRDSGGSGTASQKRF